MGSRRSAAAPETSRIRGAATFVKPCLVFQRWGWSQQLASVASREGGAPGGGGGPGGWPPPPPPQRAGRRRVRGGRPHVRHERFGRGHGALPRGGGVRRQLRLTFARLPDGVVAGLQPKTQETDEEGLRLLLWTQHIYYGKQTTCFLHYS